MGTMPDPQPLPTRFPCWCKAVYSWGGETKRDLGFIEGDLIECLNAGDGSWWMGRLRRDKRMVGLFPSNFVEVLDEDFQPWSRTSSTLKANGGGSISRGNSPNPAKATPQKTKSMFRKPFTAYAAASAPNPAAAARERIEKAGGLSPSPRGSLTHKPYSSMKRSSTESRESAAPSPLAAPSPVPSPAPRGGIGRQTYPRTAVSPTPPSRLTNHSRAMSPLPPQNSVSHHRAVSPAPPTYVRPHSQAISHPRAVSPAPSFQYRPYDRATSPRPYGDTDNPPPAHPRAVSPAPSFQYRPYSRATSPRPYGSTDDLAPHHTASYSRGVSPVPSFQDRQPPQALSQPRAVSPAPSFEYRPYNRATSPRPYGDTDDGPPPPPPPHRVLYKSSRAPSPAPYHDSGYGDEYSTPAPPSPDPRSGVRAGFTPSPLTNAMNDVMSSLQDMSVTRPATSPDEPAVPSNPWSPEAFDQVYQASAKKIRPHTSVGNQTVYPGDEDDDQADFDGPPQVQNYVQRMESRLRRLQHQDKTGASDELFLPKNQMGPPPAVPPKNPAYQPARPSSSDQQEPDPSQKRSNSRLLRHRKSAYDIGQKVLGRTWTTKTTSTTTTNSSSSTNRSLMSGHSATNMSATSAGSYYRKKLGKARPMSVMDTRDTSSKGFGFDDGRPETPFTGVTYHSSHDSRSGPGSSHQGPSVGNLPEGKDPLGGLTAPALKTKKSGFFRKVIESAKTSAATARSTLASQSRPGSRASKFEPNGISGTVEPPVQSAAARDMGLGGSIDWLQVRRDVNRANTLSKNERHDREERCQMLDIPVISPIDILYESAEGDEGLDGLPITEPTDFTSSNLALVDKSARFINSVPLGTTPASLAQGQICRPYRSDVQRLRAIFTWVSERIAWEEDFEGDIDTRQVIQTKRGCSEEIALVVAEMCGAVGLHAEVVRGYLKSPGEPLDLDAVARPNHFWNAVIVEGEWRVMDCSLASPTNPKRSQYSDVGSQVADTWYFLARPMEICYTHVPLLPEQQHICPPQQHEVLMALPCACPTYFKHRLQVVDFNTSLLVLEELELAHIYINVPEDVECVAEVEARAISQDADGDYFENGDVVKKPALAQAEWVAGQKRYTIKALLPGDEGRGVLKVYAGPRGLMHSNKYNPHSLALGLPISHTGSNPPFSFLTLHPTPHAQRHDLYVAQPQCARLVQNNTFVFNVRQHPASLTRTPDSDKSVNGRASPQPFTRPTSALSMTSISASGSAYSNPSQASSNGSNNPMKPAKLAIQTPTGKIIRLLRKSEHMGGMSESADGSVWETVIKIGEKGVWRGLVLADRSARWCVFAEWECI